MNNYIMIFLYRFKTYKEIKNRANSILFNLKIVKKLLLEKYQIYNTSNKNGLYGEASYDKITKLTNRKYCLNNKCK